MALTKSEIAERIQAELSFTKRQSIDCVETVVELIKKTLASGEDVLISAFGKFSVKSKNGRRGRNPATGSDLMLPARKVVTFRWSGRLRDKINGRKY